MESSSDKNEVKIGSLNVLILDRTITRTFLIKIVNELFASESMVLKEQDMI